MYSSFVRVEFGGKEAYMVKLNEFIENNRPKMLEYYKELKVCDVYVYVCACACREIVIE